MKDAFSALPSLLGARLRARDAAQRQGLRGRGRVMTAVGVVLGGYVAWHELAAGGLASRRLELWAPIVIGAALVVVGVAQLVLARTVGGWRRFVTVELAQVVEVRLEARRRRGAEAPVLVFVSPGGRARELFLGFGTTTAAAEELLREARSALAAPP